jgi:hypothetical protein
MTSSVGYYGFKFSRTKDGTAPDIKQFRAGGSRTATTQNIFIGDVVKLSSGLVVPAFNGEQILGVVVGFGADVTSGQTLPNNMSNIDSPQTNYLPADKAGTVSVVLADNALFTVVAGTSLTGANRLTCAGTTFDIGNATADYDAAAAHGSTATGVCSLSIVLDAGSPANELMIVDYVRGAQDYPAPTSGTIGVGEEVLVQFQNIQFNQS